MDSGPYQRNKSRISSVLLLLILPIILLRLEENTYSLNEKRVVLLDGITTGGKSTREYLEIEYYKEAIDYIEQLSAKDPVNYQKPDIFNIQSLVLKGIDSENADTYRRVPVYVRLHDWRIHKFCDPLKIVDEMDQYFTWLFARNTVYPVLRAAEAHTRLVSIHPFIDGNGNIGYRIRIKNIGLSTKIGLSIPLFYLFDLDAYSDTVLQDIYLTVGSMGVLNFGFTIDIFM